MSSPSRRSAFFAVVATLVLVGSLAAASSASRTATESTYLVLYKQQAVPVDAASSIGQAGGRLVYAYDQIGVAVATSDSAAFASILGRDNRLEGISATEPFATRLEDDAVTTDTAGDPTPATPAPGNDTLSGLQ